MKKHAGIFNVVANLAVIAIIVSAVALS